MKVTTKGFNIERFKPGAVLLRLRPANSGDRSYIGWPAKLVEIGKNTFTIMTRLSILRGEHVELELKNFRHGWVKMEDVSHPGLGLPDSVLTALENKDYYAVSSSLGHHNRVNELKVFLERQIPYKEREKYKVRNIKI
ncbi:MAG: hypothetical protein WC795_00910 [Candidatus Paceibacterota bacterium]|jgi:hypothetical protein